MDITGLTRSGARRLGRHWPLALVLLLAGVIYLPTIDTPLHGDDYFAFIDISTKPFPRFIRDVVMFKDSNVAWRPLTQVYYYGLFQLAGLYGPAYHFANFVLFEATLAALYWLCLVWGLGRWVAAGAAAIMGIFPAHVVTVIWVTSGGRMFAVFLFLVGLILLIRGVRARRLLPQFCACLLFALAFLSDETMVVLAPIGVLAALAFEPPDGRLRRTLIRAAVVLAPAAAVGLPQVLLAPRGSTGQVAATAAIPQHLWGLAGRMTEPTGPVLMRDLPELQWALGAVTLAGLALLLAVGSLRAKVLAAWTFAALAPFALTLPITPGRYVYPALVPFSILLAWAAGAIVPVALRIASGAVPRQPSAALLRAAGAAAFTAAVLAAALYFGPMTRQKDAAFAADATKYHTLAVELKRALPNVEPGTTLVIYYGVWDEPYGFVSAVARTVYRDPTITVVNIPRGQVEQGRPVYAKERRLFNTQRGLIAASDDVLLAR